jgi:alpha-mannosidase
VDALTPASTNFTHGVDFADASFSYVLPAWNAEGSESRITQRFRVMADGDSISCDVHCEWNGVGTNKQPNALLRVAFDVQAEHAAATYHVPFGMLSRPTDGREYPVLQWADIGDAAGGVSVLNDAKHGFAAKGSTLTMSLIRSPFDPDPVPNPGAHHWRYAIVTRAGELAGSRIAQRAAAFNQPLLAATVPYDGSGPAPLEWGALGGGTESIVVTSLKRAEDGDACVLRMYEPRGAACDALIPIAIRASAAQTVNLIEDPLPGSLLMQDGKLPLKLRPFEIRTIKLLSRVEAPPAAR